MSRGNGDKYVTWHVFMWIVGGLAGGVIGFVLMSGGYLIHRQDKQTEQISDLRVEVASVKTGVDGIIKFLNEDLDIQGVVDERVERMVQKQFQIALDPRIATPADIAELASSTLKGGE